MSRAKKDTEKLTSLTEERLLEYANFRRNLRLLRATTDLSAEKLSREIGFQKFHRVSDLEYGRSAVPKLGEVKAIASYFRVAIDELLYKVAVVSFTDPKPYNYSIDKKQGT